MLTIVKGSNEADIYFAKDNYYTKTEGIKHSQWQGKGAVQLGLQGQIGPDQFNVLLKGEIDGQQLGRLVQGKIQHRSGWDLTFSAPKSLSILSEVYGISVLRTIHEQAVMHTLCAVEELLDSRLTNNNKTHVVATNNGVFASFTHDVNRNLDCQLHTHCYLLNMTHTDHGWRSLYTERLFQSQRTKQLGLVYRTALAIFLKQAGYALTHHRDPSLFEIEGVSQSLIDEFSTRSKEIEKWFKTRKIPYDSIMAKTVALMSRKNKVQVDRTKLVPLWQKRAASYAIDIEALKKPLITKLTKLRPAKQVIKQALNHLGERDMGFSLNVLVAESVKFGLGGIHLADIDKAIAQMIKRGEIVGSRTHENNKTLSLWTTPRMKELETELIRAVSNNFSSGKGLVRADYADKQLAKTRLNVQQRAAIFSALTTNDRFFGIQGDPGVGKTTALREYKKILAEKGYEVLAMAPSYQAVDELSESLSIQGITVDRYLSDPNSNKLGRPFKPQVWVVDEVSMLATDRLVELMTLAEQRKARVIFVGDHQQLESVGSGRAFKHLQAAGLETQVLNHWVRPKTDFVRDVYDRVLKQDYAGTISLLDSAGNIFLHKEEKQGISALAESWLALNSVEKNHTQIIAPSNDQCSMITDIVRKGLRAQGELDNKEHIYTTLRPKFFSNEQLRSAMAYQLDNVVRFTESHLVAGKPRQMQINRNEYFTVIGINQETNILALTSKQDRRTIYVDPLKFGGKKDGGIQVFTEQVLSVAKGDKIRWLDNKNHLGLKRNAELTVGRLSDQWIRLDKKNGDQVKVPLGDFTHQHFTHNYAKTAYGVQGASKRQVMALMTSWRTNTTHARSFMVALTRATHDIKLYTDSVSELVRGLSGRCGSNTEALTGPEFERAVKIIPTPRKSRSLQQLI